MDVEKAGLDMHIHDVSFWFWFGLVLFVSLLKEKRFWVKARLEGCKLGRLERDVLPYAHPKPKGLKSRLMKL